MLLERFYDEDLSQASYLIACQASGEAVVVDPRRDIAVYTDFAARHGLRIVAVTETHIHADYLSGTRELAATGATAYVSGEGGEDWAYGFEAERLHDGEAITLGNITVRARHTPGHTPEHLTFLVTDGAFADEPGYALTGDFVFAGDLGRPDLLDEAAGGVDTRFQGAADLYASLQRVFLELPDHVQVFPAHGAGSACGKALGALPSTTVGYERRHAWWARHLAADDQQAFTDELLDGQPDAHAYFSRMKRENRDGPAVLGALPVLTETSVERLRAGIEAEELLLVDTRPQAEVRAGSVPGALSVPGPATAARFGAWVLDPERESRPVVVLADSAAQAAEIRDHLIRVGIDGVDGYTTTLDGLERREVPTISPADLEARSDVFLLDVRTRTEYQAGHVPGATHLSAGRVLWHLEDLPEDTTIVSYCQSGARNTVAAAALRREGYDVLELEGSYLGWSAAQGDAA